MSLAEKYLAEAEAAHQKIEQGSEELAQIAAIRQELSQSPGPSAALGEPKRGDRLIAPAESKAPATHSDYSKLPWKTNKARIDWVFSNLPEAKDLLDSIGKQKGNSLIDGGFEYKVSGEAGKFINRTKAK